MPQLFYIKTCERAFISIHRMMPVTVGSKQPRKAHFMLPVSFFMLIKVVEQGQCKREKIVVQMAVTQVHPFSTNNCFKVSKLLNSEIVPCDM